MKKRCFLLSILLVFSMLLGACGSGDPFKGTWTGRLDVTKQFEDGIIAAFQETNPELVSYVDFEDLVFVIDVVFEEGMMLMHVREDSITAFNDNFAAGMMKIEKGSLMELLKATDVTLEEAVAESGMTEEEYIVDRLSNEEVRKVFDTMSTGMTDVTNKALHGFNSVDGTYTFNEEELHVRYKDDRYESIEYVFEGDNLILIFRGMVGEMPFSLRVECEKQK